MIRYLLVTIVGLTSLSCSQPIEVKKSELKQIFRELTEEDITKTKHFIIDSIEKFDEKSIEELDTVFSIASSTEVDKGLWTNEIFNSARIVSKNYLNDISKHDPLTMTPTHYSFSLPYFSKDKNSFVIYYNYYCGNLCAEYSLRLYRKINGRWTFMRTFFNVVS